MCIVQYINYQNNTLSCKKIKRKNIWDGGSIYIHNSICKLNHQNIHVDALFKLLMSLVHRLVKTR